jgi:hypothetical protein
MGQAEDSGENGKVLVIDSNFYKCAMAFANDFRNPGGVTRVANVEYIEVVADGWPRIFPVTLQVRTTYCADTVLTLHLHCTETSLIP